jgi:uncharacterized cupredoxin-like copper-binding protein
MRSWENFHRSSNSTRTTGAMPARRVIAMTFALAVGAPVSKAQPSQPTLIPILLADFNADSIKKIRDGRVVLHAGETVDITVTTGEAGSFSMRCTYFGHSLMGMTGRLEVGGPSRTN